MRPVRGWTVVCLPPGSSDGLARPGRVTYKSRMARRATKTGFDRFVDEQMRSPSFAKAYEEARAEVDAVDRIVREIDRARRQLGMTKAELGRAAGIRPELVRRLFTSEEPNPTLETVMRVMQPVGLKLVVAPFTARRSRTRRGKRSGHGTTLRGVRARYSSPSRRTSA